MTRSECIGSKLLEQALDAYADGRREICRGLCFNILRNLESECETRISAYALLSILASWSVQAMVFLNAAWDLAGSAGETIHHELPAMVATLMHVAMVEEKYGALKLRKQMSGTCCVKINSTQSSGFRSTMPVDVRDVLAKLGTLTGSDPSPIAQTIVDWAISKTLAQLKDGHPAIDEVNALYDPWIASCF